MKYVLTVEFDIPDTDDVYPEHFMNRLAVDLEDGKTSGVYEKEQSQAVWSIKVQEPSKTPSKIFLGHFWNLF